MPTSTIINIWPIRQARIFVEKHHSNGLVEANRWATQFSEEQQKEIRLHLKDAYKRAGLDFKPDIVA